MKKLALTFVFGLGLATAGSATAPAHLTFAPAAIGGGGQACPDVWKPVICSDGNVYSNSCYASLAGASGCVPYGDAAAAF